MFGSPLPFSVMVALMFMVWGGRRLTSDLVLAISCVVFCIEITLAAKHVIQTDFHRCSDLNDAVPLEFHECCQPRSFRFMNWNGLTVRTEERV